MGQFEEQPEGNVAQRKVRQFWDWLTSGGILSGIKIVFVAVFVTALLTKNFDLALLVGLFGFLGREVALHAVDPTYKGHWLIREFLGEPGENQ